MRGVYRAQRHPAAIQNRRFDLSPIDALINLAIGGWLCCQIPIRLDVHPVIHLRITTVIPQWRLACRGDDVEVNARFGGGKSQVATTAMGLLKPFNIFSSRPSKSNIKSGESSEPATQRKSTSRRKVQWATGECLLAGDPAKHLPSTSKSLGKNAASSPSSLFTMGAPIAIEYEALGEDKTLATGQFLPIIVGLIRMKGLPRC